MQGLKKGLNLIINIGGFCFRLALGIAILSIR